MSNELLTTGGPHSPYPGGGYQDLGVDERMKIIDFEARTGGKVDACLVWPVIEYWQGLAKYYEMQLRTEQATWQTNAGSPTSAPLPVDSAASACR